MFVDASINDARHVPRMSHDLANTAKTKGIRMTRESVPEFFESRARSMRDGKSA